MGAGLEIRKEWNMAIIGTFKTTDTGFTGTLTTLSLKVPVNIRRVEKDSDKAPDFRIYRQNDDYECGAAWQKVSREDRPYASVKFDDPGFPAPIYASLIEGDIQDQYTLIWSR
jgi:uncharacterized protein (DUF736 family)